MFSDPMTLDQLAIKNGWDKGSRLLTVRKLIKDGRVVRRLVPVGSLTTKRRVVYQQVAMWQVCL